MLFNAALGVEQNTIGRQRTLIRDWNGFGVRATDGGAVDPGGSSCPGFVQLPERAGGEMQVHRIVRHRQEDQHAQVPQQDSAAHDPPQCPLQVVPTGFPSENQSCSFSCKNTHLIDCSMAQANLKPLSLSGQIIDRKRIWCCFVLFN